jgi:hypothetical protein
MDRWDYPNKVHIIADAAFGSMNLMNDIHEKV